MSIPSIEVRGVGKRYVKYDDTPMLVTRLLSLRNRTTRGSLWAMRDADFDVQPGEAVGIIGRNGSGKTTLLAMLAGTTAPTEGRVTVRGRIAPLISVGVGFHPELNGRENVYVNGTILGLARAELDRRFDEIVAFAEIEEFIDTPVKFYSSGMFVRLGFAVSAMAEPDVLLIDEVLAVGDLAFQLKCFDRIQQLREAGTTIVLVTHNLNAIRQVCGRALVVHGGRIRFDGDPVSGLSLYHELLGQVDEETAVEADGPVDAADLTDFRLLGPGGDPTHHIRTRDRVVAEVAVAVHRPLQAPILAIAVVNEAGVHAYGESFAVDDVLVAADGQPTRFAIAFTAGLATGSYSLYVALASANGDRLAASPPPILFYVAGRASVEGVTDLGGSLTIR